ncbi:MAG: porin family protein [Porphyromonadaceae bacterium]|nr:porin family protein [Porphyromonadaceae bacterium]
MNRDNEIRRELQSKFSDYRVPIPSDGWDRLEQSLNAARTMHRTVRRRWYAVSAAAAVILLVGGLFFFRPTADIITPLISESESSVSHTESQYHGIPKDEVPAHEDIAATPTSPATIHTIPGYRKQGKNNLIANVIPARIGNMLQGGRILLVDVKRNITDDDFPSILEQIKRQLTSSLIGETGSEVYIAVGEEQAGLINEEEPEQIRKEPIILAMNGRGGLAPFQQTVNTPMTLRSAQLTENNSQLGDSRMMLTTNNTAGNVSEMEHDQPVSFGITVSKSLFDNLSLETGFLYTYLSSKVRNSGTNFQVQESQHLHYLGIPLNVNYNLFSLKRLDVYASVGGMFEKDVYGEYRRTGEQKSTELNISSEEEITKISQRNPQISVNAGLGVSYPVWQNLKLYGKIGGAYYFDANNQYKTIYSDSKIVMDLNVGLRYEFK